MRSFAAAFGAVLALACVSCATVDKLKEEIDKEPITAEWVSTNSTVKRDEYRQQVTMPMELLAAIFPLMADQSRFVQLVLRQMDLAERLSTLKGRDGEDSPALKTRMRELEEEQREIRSQLDELLDDILNHLTEKRPADKGGSHGNP